MFWGCNGIVTVGGEEHPIIVLRDTGAAQSLWVAESSVLSPSSSLNVCALIQGVNSDPGEFKAIPLHQVHLQSSLVTGVVTVGVLASLPIPGVTFVLGNDLAGEKVCVTPLISKVPVESPETEALQQEFPTVFPTGVVTRSQANNQEVPKEVGEEPSELGVILGDTFFAQDATGDQKFNREDLIREQRGHPIISDMRSQAGSLEDLSGEAVGFYMLHDVLMRKWRDPECSAAEEWRVYHQLVLPPCYRSEILRLAHEIPTSGHLGINKTKARVMRHFYWPNLRKDVVEFCRTCHECKLGGKANQVVPPALLVPIPAFGEPFSRVLTDCVGPLPRTKRGHQYLLTVMDVSTRFLEAFPLRNISAKSVLDCLLKFFTQVGLPREIQSDQGSNFMSGVFQAVMRELGVKHFKSSTYHPQSQGALERHHQTLKSMIRAYCLGQAEEWDKSIPFLLFAIRDSVCESTGFSPFELVYGHEVRGPLKLVKERFLAEAVEDKVLDYVSEFKERLRSACAVARSHLQSAQRKMKDRFDRKAVTRSFEVGDKVLVLLPVRGDPLQAHFSSPYTIKEKLSDVNYVVNTPDRRKSTRLCHINMLKRYYERGPVPVTSVCVVHVDESEKADPSEMAPMEVRLLNSVVLSDLDRF